MLERCQKSVTQIVTFGSELMHSQYSNVTVQLWRKGEGSWNSVSEGREANS